MCSLTLIICLIDSLSCLKRGLDLQPVHESIAHPEVMHTTVDTVVQNQVETIEVIKPTVAPHPALFLTRLVQSNPFTEVHKVVQRKKPVIQEQVQHVPKAR